MPPTLSTTTKVDHLCLNSLSTLEPAKSWKSFLKGDKTVKKMNYCFTVLKLIWRAGGRPVFLINTVLIFCLAQTKVISPPKTHIREDKHQLFLQGAQWVHTLKPSDGQAESLPRAGRDIPRDSGGSLPTTRPPLSCLQALPARHVMSHHITSHPSDTSLCQCWEFRGVKAGKSPMSSAKKPLAQPQKEVMICKQRAVQAWLWVHEQCHHFM